jgi:hypothetical protein
MHATLDRLGRTIERNTATIDRNTATIERNMLAFERNQQAFERNQQAFEDLQVVIRENRILGERNAQGFAEDLREILNRHDAAFNELRDEIRANTRAVWRMVDRWGEGPTPAS